MQKSKLKSFKEDTCFGIDTMVLHIGVNLTKLLAFMVLPDCLMAYQANLYLASNKFVPVTRSYTVETCVNFPVKRANQN